MKRFIGILAAAGAAAVMMAAAQPATAAPVPAPCAAGWNCWWSETGFTGQTYSWQGTGVPGRCTGGPGYQLRSYAFYGGQEGYFYESSNCTGPSRAAVYNTERADLGFIAHSFKPACVSCLSSADRQVAGSP